MPNPPCRGREAAGASIGPSQSDTTPLYNECAAVESFPAFIVANVVNNEASLVIHAYKARKGLRINGVHIF